jgi:ABC-type Fe3+-hydroxamate transport system substrate-binding protein
VDSNTFKQGLCLPGTGIPIVDEAQIPATKPDYILILPWNLRKEIEKQIEFSREWGCEFIAFIGSAS